MLNEVLSPNFNDCPFCAVIENFGTQITACYSKEKTYEYFIRFCCLCGKEFLSYDEWYEKQKQLKDDTDKKEVKRKSQD